MIFKSSCISCDMSLLMVFPKFKMKNYSCSKCVSKHNSLRDNINESYDFEFLFLNRRKK